MIQSLIKLFASEMFHIEHDSTWFNISEEEMSTGKIKFSD